MKSLIRSALLLGLVFTSLVGRSHAQQLSRFPYTSNGKIVDAFHLMREGMSREAREVSIGQMSNTTGQVQLLMGAEPIGRGGEGVLSMPKQGDSIAAMKGQAGRVKRKGDSLVVEAGAGAVFEFKNGARKAEAFREADSVTFGYRGLVASQLFHRIDLFDAHDASGTFLVHTVEPLAIYFQTSTDLVVMSTGLGKFVQMSDGLNSPFAIAVGKVSSVDVSYELVCQANFRGNLTIAPLFKGWHVSPHIGFDFAVIASPQHYADAPEFSAFAVRASFANNQWRVESNQPKQLIDQTQFMCWGPQ